MTPDTLQTLAHIQAGYRAILAITRDISDAIGILSRQEGHYELANALSGDTARLITQAAHVANGLACRLREAIGQTDAAPLGR